MDWYYPVLGGSVRGPGATAWLAAGWPDFVVPGLGVRCVRDEPWVTGAETCELVLALDATGDRSRAREMFAEIQFLRDPDGGYWTGWQFVNHAPCAAQRRKTPFSEKPGLKRSRYSGSAGPPSGNEL